MRALMFLLLLGPLAALGAESHDGFVWIDANTKVKSKPESAAAGGSAPEKAPEPSKKPKSKRKADK